MRKFIYNKGESMSRIKLNVDLFYDVQSCDPNYMEDSVNYILSNIERAQFDLACMTEASKVTINKVIGESNESV